MKLIKLLRKPNAIQLVIVVLFGLWAGKGLIGPGYFNMHDDLQMMRQLELEKCFLDGQIPCRWVPDMGYGFGYPLFNFYPPLPYLVGELFRTMGFAFTETVKMTFILSFIGSGITMYFLAKEFFGKSGGVISAIFYIWAPYHAVDVYVRGAMNEAWALIWFPAILYTGYKLLIEKKGDFKWIVLLALSWFALFTSHNLMVLIFGPVFAVWILMWLIYYNKWSKIPQLIIAGFWSFSLAAFFTIPVLLEKGIVQTDTLVVGYYEYTAHFVSVSQLFLSRFWGYGPSVWGVVDDKMSFQIGWVHWITSLAVIAFTLPYFYQNLTKKTKKKIDPLFLAIVFMFSAGWIAAFMTHNKSTPIWKSLSLLQFVQFPWRFLTLVILSFSFLGGAFTKLFKFGTGKIVSIILVILVIAYSYNYFVPETGKLGPLTDEEKFSGAAWELQQTAGIYDYLPNTADTAPKAPMTELIEFIEGSGAVKSSSQGTDWAMATFTADEDSLIRIGILQFPNWTTTLNGQEIENFVPEEEEWGRMYIRVPEGTHTLDIQLENTWPRTYGNYISIAAWAILAALITRKYRESTS